MKTLSRNLDAEMTENRTQFTSFVVAGRMSKRLDNLQEFRLCSTLRENFALSEREWNSAQGVIHSLLQI